MEEKLKEGFPRRWQTTKRVCAGDYAAVGEDLDPPERQSNQAAKKMGMVTEFENANTQT